MGAKYFDECLSGLSVNFSVHFTHISQKPHGQTSPSMDDDCHQSLVFSLVESWYIMYFLFCGWHNGTYCTSCVFQCNERVS